MTYNFTRSNREKSIIWATNNIFVDCNIASPTEWKKTRTFTIRGVQLLFPDKIIIVYQKALIRTLLIRFVYQKSLTHSSYHLIDCKITFVISQRKNTNSEGNFVLKNRFETFVFKISGIQKILNQKYKEPPN